MGARLAAYEKATASVAEEREGLLRVGEGTLPTQLRGVLYRNGPGRREAHGTPYAHPFDGDGMVTRFGFGDGAVTYRNRFVRTREYLAEERAQAMMFRSFGTNLPGGPAGNAFRVRFKNAANTGVCWHGGRLLALWEGGLPHRLDPTSLATLGREDYGGGLQSRRGHLERLLAPELPFSAHPKIDAATGELFNFGVLMGRRPSLVLYRVSREGVLETPTFLPLARLSFVHDFVITPRYWVFFLFPVAFRLGRALLGLDTPAGSLAQRAGGKTTVLLVPRQGGQPIQLQVPGGFVYHFVNGFDAPDGTVVVDGLRADRLITADAAGGLLRGDATHVPASYLTRYILDPTTGRTSEEQIGWRPSELPSCDVRKHGQPYDTFFALAADQPPAQNRLNQIARYDLRAPHRPLVRDFGHDFPGEPLFVPDTAADASEAGFVLSLVYRSAFHRSDLYVLRGSDLSTVCRLELPHHVPPGLHGTWADAR